jgi:hypothetical protein
VDARGSDNYNALKMRQIARDVGHDEWPNLFIVGVGKAGTSSLADYLGQHPQIYMSTPKEPHFFSAAASKIPASVTSQHEYLALFAPGRAAKLRGEASVSYFWDRATPQAIKEVSPTAKILVIMRDPIARSYSHYWYLVRFGRERRTFLGAIEEELAGRRRQGIDPYIARSLYSVPLERYYAEFGENVYVLFFEELLGDLESELRKVFSFLGVDPGAADAVQPHWQNRFAHPRNKLAARFLGSRRLRGAARAVMPAPLRSRIERLLLREGAKPPMAPEALSLLQGAFTEDRIRLERLLRRPMPWPEIRPAGDSSAPVHKGVN